MQLKHLKGLIEDYINSWKECYNCNMMIKPDLIQTDVPDVICKDCYEENIS